MELSQLHALLTIAELGSFTRAAERLCLTQSALSHKIKTLERECGTTLLVRGRHVTATTAGTELIAAAKRIQFEMDSVKSYLAKSDGELRGILRIVSTAKGLTYVYWHLLEQFIEAFPQIQLIIGHVASPSDGSRQVQMGMADLALAPLPIAASFSRLEVVPLGSVEHVLVVAPKHALATRETVRIKDLREVPMVLQARGPGEPMVTDRVLTLLGGSPSTLTETAGIEYIKRLVMLGRGASILPWPAIEQEVATGKLVRVHVEEGNFYQDFGIVHAAGWTSRAVQAFCDFCRENPLSTHSLIESPS